MLALLDQNLSLSHPSALVRVQSALAYSESAWMNWEMDKAHELVAQGLEEAERSGVRVMDNALWGQACYAALASGDSEALARGLAGMRRALNPQSRLDKVHCLYFSSLLALLQGKHEQGLEQARLVLAEAGHLSCHIPILMGRIAVVYALGLKGQFEEALTELAPAEDYARRMRSSLFESVCGLQRAWLLLCMARPAEALQHLSPALALCRQHALPGTYTWFADMLSPICALALRHGLETELVQQIIALRQLPPPEDEAPPGDWPFAVKIHALGRFGIFLRGQPVKSTAKARKKPLELLRLLVALGGSAVNEVRIMERLWPDAEGDMARQNLKVTVYRLRKLIGGEALIVNEGRLSLDRRWVWMDLWVLQAELEKGKADVIAETVWRLLDHYPGPLLPDCEFPEAIAARESIRSRFLRALEQFCGQLILNDEYEEAAACYERALAVEPLAENLYRGLMHCYLEQGRRADGLGVYARCEKVLHASLGVAPSDETRELAEQLKG